MPVIYDHKKIWPRSLLFFICCIFATMGWFFARGIPPMQSPDEPQHIARAYMLSQGELMLHQVPEKMSGGFVDGALLNFINLYSRLAGQPNEKITFEEQASIGGEKWQNTKEKSFFEVPGTGYYLPLVYMPHALGLRIGEFLGWSIEDSYQLSRFSVLLSCFALLAWAFTLQKPPHLVVALLWLPMSVFQFLMPTLDGFTTSLAFLSISLFLWMWRQQVIPPTWASATLALCLLLVTTSRLHLLPLLFLAFMVFWRWRQKRDLWLCLILISLAVSWIIYALTSTIDGRVHRTHGTGELVRQYVLAPWEFFAILSHTLTQSDLLAFYGRSMIGILGWLDAPLRDYFYPWIASLIIACMFVSITSITSAPARLMKQVQQIFLVTAIFSILLIFFALLVTWTPHPATTVEGVQGRYFTVPALLLAYSLGGDWPPSRLRRWFSRGTLGALICLCMYALVLGLQDRYCTTPMQYTPLNSFRLISQLDPLKSCPHSVAVSKLP